MNSVDTHLIADSEPGQRKRNERDQLACLRYGLLACAVLFVVSDHLSSKMIVKTL